MIQLTAVWPLARDGRRAEALDELQGVFRFLGASEVAWRLPGVEMWTARSLEWDYSSLDR